MNKKPQILIVDDEPYARQTIEMLLLKESYELFFAEDAHEALAQLDDEIPDVILSDVMMPNMDGFELCQRIKRNPKWNHVPIILVTALDSKQDLARGLEAGADDFLHKPINGLELRARVRSMLRIKLRHDELQAALQMRQDLANMIVHDIRSPLSTILIYCDLLEAELEGPVPTLETIRGEANRLSSFLTDMLMMAKMEHGRLMLSHSPVDVNEMATAVRDSYAPMARLKDIDLKLDLPEQSPARVISTWRGPDGQMLSPRIAAVELLNILRPTVAVSVFITFTAHALHQFPTCRQKFRADDGYLECFVQEVRRRYPFFPAVMARVRRDFEWKGYRFPRGRRVVLDLYGTNRDPRAWDAPEEFRPERFQGWDGSPFHFIPQGGGDHHRNHRCPGEWITIEIGRR